MSIDTNDEKSKLFMYMGVFLIYCAGRVSLQYCIYGWLCIHYITNYCRPPRQWNLLWKKI